MVHSDDPARVDGGMADMVSGDFIPKGAETGIVQISGMICQEPIVTIK